MGFSLYLFMCERSVGCMPHTCIGRLSKQQSASKRRLTGSQCLVGADREALLRRKIAFHHA